ncbi:MAG: ABC transporter permease subunit [Chloroflexi bacterium]|nr:ABC transporter permease subunit [Chloroflexota bacterium]
MDDVSLSVDDRELLCLLGPSGCGKSTLLGIIAGLEQPDAGEVRFLGQRQTRGPLAAVVWQEYALIPWRSTLDNVAFGLEARGVPRAERLRVAREWLDLVGVRSVEPVLIRMATNLGASKPQIMLQIVLPGALPVMFAGLRLALGLALLGDVAAEFAASTDGIGALTWLYWQVYQIENMYAYLTVIAIVGALLTYGLEWLGNSLMPWSRPLRGE